MGSIRCNDDIAIDYSPFIRIHNDGHVERLSLSPRIPPIVDPLTGVHSRDVIISSSDPVLKARIFIPTLDVNGSDQKLPLLIYYHGGAFCIGSPFNTYIRNFLTPIVSQSKAIAIALEYRLAPENPLPIAFHDSWAGFQWVASHLNGSGPDQFLNNHADFDQVFLGGESAGSTIAQHVAVKGSMAGLTGLNLRGLVAVHPFFSTEKVVDKMLQYLYPTCSGPEIDPLMNPGADTNLVKMGCSRVLVFVAEKDFLKPRGVTYCETLKKSGWEGSVECVETEGEDHCFHFRNPAGDNAMAMVHKVISFITQERLINS